MLEVVEDSLAESNSDLFSSRMANFLGQVNRATAHPSFTLGQLGPKRTRRGHARKMIDGGNTILPIPRATRGN